MASGKFQPEDLEKIANAFSHRTLKLQIGCGAEPSLFSYNKEIILLAKRKKVPYISMTTNANLLSKNDINELKNNIPTLKSVLTIRLTGIISMNWAIFSIFSASIP